MCLHLRMDRDQINIALTCSVSRYIQKPFLNDEEGISQKRSAIASIQKLERTHRHFSKQVRTKVRMLAVKSAINQLDLVNGQYVAPTPEIVSMIHADVILEVVHYVFSSRARACAHAHSNKALLQAHAIQKPDPLVLRSRPLPLSSLPA